MKFPRPPNPYCTPAVRTLSPHSAPLAPVTECLPQMAHSTPRHPVDHRVWTQLYPLGLLCLLWTPWYDPLGFNPVSFNLWLLKVSPHMAQCLESVESSRTWLGWGIKHICPCAMWPSCPSLGGPGGRAHQPLASHTTLCCECERSSRGWSSLVTTTVPTLTSGTQTPTPPTVRS